MKTLILLPVAYVADVQGLLMFAPYVALFLSVALYVRLARRRERAAVPVRVRRR